MTPTDFGIEEDEELEEKCPLGSGFTTVLKEPIKKEEEPIVERNVKSEIRALLTSADKSIQKGNRKGCHINIINALKLLEEL